MELEQILQLIFASELGGWHILDENIVRTWESGHQDGYPFSRPIMHNNSAVYRQDIDIKLAWGAVETEEFNEPWHQAFPDHAASSVWVDLLYRGSRVSSWMFVIVDGGRYLVRLPTPNADGTYSIRQNELGFSELIFQLYSHGQGPYHTLLEAFQACAITVI